MVILVLDITLVKPSGLNFGRPVVLYR